MNKYLIIALVTLGLISCTTKNEQYYLSHPKELQQALKACPSQVQQGLSCEKLQQLGERMNALAYQLQSSPQGFGSRIISLQENIAKQELTLKEKKTQEIEASLLKSRQELAEYLAVVKWLESPES